MMMDKRGVVEIKWWMLALILAILALLILLVAVIFPASKNLMAALKIW